MTDTTEQDTDQHSIRSFSMLLGKLEGGNLHEDMTIEYRELMDKMAEIRMNENRDVTGSITLTIGVKMEREGTVTVRGDIKAKHPKVTRGGSVFWTDKNNLLTPRNPAQQDLPFREVTGNRNPVKNI